MDSKLNIGVTICLQQENESVWINGIKQNAIFLARTFMNSQKNYNVYIVNTSNIKITNGLGWDVNHYKTVQFNDIKDQLDIIFPLGGSLNADSTNYLRKRDCKVVPYACGNEYIISMENVIFGRGNQKIDYPEVDQVWHIPQMKNTNEHYWRVLYRTEAITIPFVWNPMFLESNINELKSQGKITHYQPSKGGKRLSIFEPNVNVYKYTVYPLLIIEDLYRRRPELISKVKSTNTQKIRFHEEFVYLMMQLDIVKNGIATFEDRYPMPWFLSEHTDVVVAHQWENALNYAYLDAIYMGYPLVHNAHLCKDCGYYYEGFNIDEGREQLLYALTEHDKHIEEYEEKSKKTIERFSSDNMEVVEKYDVLIDNLMNKKLTNKERFDKVYFNNKWNIKESRSGKGSMMENTKNIREELPKIFKKYKIKRLIDASCGDFNWMKSIVDNLDVYKGVDVVKDLVDSNNYKYLSKKVSFDCCDIVESFDYNGKKFDMILCRDALVHLTFDNVKKVLENFKKSGIKYLLMTHMCDCPTNIEFLENIENSKIDIWHPINFTINPFNMDKPIDVIMDNAESYDLPMINYIGTDKSLSLWKIN